MKILVVGPGPVRPGAPSSTVAGEIADALVKDGHSVIALDSGADSSLAQRLTGPLDDATVARIRTEHGFDRIAIEGAHRIALTEGPWLGASPADLAVVVPGGTLDVVCASDGDKTIVLAAFACSAAVAISDAVHRSVELPASLDTALGFRGVGTIRFRDGERLGVDRGDTSLFAAAGLVSGVRIGTMLGHLLAGRSLSDAMGNPLPPRTVTRTPSTDFSAWPGADATLGLRAKTFRSSLLASRPSIPSKSKERILVTGPERAFASAGREIERLGHEAVGLGRSEMHAFRTYYGESLEAVRALERPDAIVDLTAREDGDEPAPDDAIELHVLAIADGTAAQILGTFEHVERAAVHADDAAAVFPSLRIAETRIREAEDAAVERARAHRGLVTARFAVNADQAAAPAFLGLTHGVTTHMLSLAAILERDLVAAAVRVMLGAPLPAPIPAPAHVAVEEHVFPFAALGASDPVLDRAPRSTGSVLSIAETVQQAYAGALASMGVRLRRTGGPFLLSGPAELGSPIADLGRRLFALGFDLVATPAAATWLERVRVPHRKVEPTDEIARSCVGIVAADPNDSTLRHAALVLGIPCFTTVDLARVAVLALEGEAQ